MRTPRHVLLCLGVAAAPLLAACGDDDEGGADTTTAAVEATTAPPGTASTATSAASSDDAASTTASSDDDGTPTEDIDEFVEIGAEQLDIGDEELSRCVVRSVIDFVGFDNIVAAGLTPEEFTQADSLADTGITVDTSQASQLQSELAGCGDLVAAIAEDVTDEQAQCTNDVLTNELVAEVLVVELLDVEPSEELQAARTAVQECAGDDG